MFKRYLLYFFSGFFLLYAGYFLTYHICLWRGLDVPLMPSQELYDYQMEKLKEGSAQAVFIGDSSLGNAINAALFTRVSGQKTLNLALTGSFGYRGTFAMLKAAHKHNPDLRRIYIMQTLDMMKRPIAPEYKPPLRLFSNHSRLDVNISIFTLTALKSFGGALSQGKWNIQAEHQDKIIIHDYVKQGKPKNYSEQYPAFTAAEIRREKATYLKKIASYCKENGLTCLYMHGPVIQEQCNNSRDYLNAVNAIIQNTGLKLVESSPLCIAPEKIGDSSDHVAPPYKDEFTQAYYKLLP